MSKTGLSKRQQLIARLLFEMDNRSEIAEQLEISINTVHNHVKRIYKKMDVSNKKDLLIKLEINGYINTEQLIEYN
jgi:DNA-binding CsgD family transcriptional regulator